MREMMQSSPFPGNVDDFERGLWPAEWIGCGADVPHVSAYRLAFESEAAETVRLHVSADERYALYLDGEEIGRGPERGDREHWFYETYRVECPAGSHVLVVKVWALGEDAPVAQISARPGFVLAADGQPVERFNTGRAPWQVKLIDGVEHIAGGAIPIWFVGTRVRIDGSAWPWGIERGEGDGWGEPTTLRPAQDELCQWGEARGHELRPAMLPAMLDRLVSGAVVRHVEDGESPPEAPTQVLAANHLADEQPIWQAMLDGDGPVTVPANTRRRIVVDLDDYYCAYSCVRTSGGAGSRIAIRWAEGLFNETEAKTKDNRDEIEGKYFIGRGDEFLPDGSDGRTFEPLWWNCGRYVELTVVTGEQPLTIEAVPLRETRYPLEMTSRYEADDPRLGETFTTMFRTLQMCCHETYMDCPYYEQLMYAGDTRLQVLVTYVTGDDDRPPRKALRMFDASRNFQGLSEARYPSRVPQYIPAFSLYWASMVYDYALWRDDPAFVAGLLPGVRSVVETYLAGFGSDGLPRNPEGWDWVDWVPTWNQGQPDRGGADVCGIRSWLLVYVLGLAAQLERWHGEAVLADRLDARRARLAKRATETFWDEPRGLMATDPGHEHFSEHAQCLTILSGTLDADRRKRMGESLLADDDLDRATIYFRHYLFETFRELGRMDAFFDRLDLWYGLAGQGFRTCLEMPEPSRSDCHAWGAHPIYHAFASVLGVRPASPGFGTVSIRPQLAHLQQACGEMPHPQGRITVDLRRSGKGLTGCIGLPVGIDGELTWAGRTVRLAAGENSVEL